MDRDMKYKFWMALVRLSEVTNADHIDDGADFVYNIEDQIKKLESDLK